MAPPDDTNTTGAENKASDTGAAGADDAANATAKAGVVDTAAAAAAADTKKEVVDDPNAHLNTPAAKPPVVHEAGAVQPPDDDNAIIVDDEGVHVIANAVVLLTFTHEGKVILGDGIAAEDADVESFIANIASRWGAVMNARAEKAAKNMHGHILGRLRQLALDEWDRLRGKGVNPEDIRNDQHYKTLDQAANHVEGLK